MKYCFTLFFCIHLVVAQSIGNVYGKNIIPSVDETGDIRGLVIDDKTGEVISNALVFVKNLGIEVYTNAEGKFLLTKLPDKEISLVIIYDGYLIKEYNAAANQTGEITIKLSQNTLDLETVVVVGTTGVKNTTTSTHINRKAIEHLQATSLQEVLQLIPGNLVSNPDFSNANQASIRQYGADKLGSLGTSVIINGASISNNANLQAINTATAGSGAGFSSSSGGGVDLRSVNADNIESVEVIRGIPSVEYGDLNTGAIIVQTKASKEPLQLKARFNPTVTQFWGGKGFDVGHKNRSLYVDLDYTKSNDKETNHYQNYTRTTGTVQFTTLLGRQKNWRSNSTLAFSQSRDIYDMDPDFVVDSSKNTSRESNFRFSTNGVITLDRKLSRNIRYNFSSNYGIQKGYQQQFYTADITAESYALENSTNEVSYLPSSYMSRMWVDGKPLSLAAKVTNQMNLFTSSINHNILTGAEWNYDVNLGNGKTFTRPPRNTSSSAYRVRPFDDIPALNQIGLFVQDQMSAVWGFTRVNLVAGLRYDFIQPFDSDYHLNALSPRLNFSVRFPGKITFRGGYGITAKAPTLLYIYPENAYFDFYSLNHYTQNPDERMALISTRVYGSENNDLKLARTYKSEIGLDYEWGTLQKKRISLTGYHENTPNGYTMSTTLNSVRFAHYPVYNVAERPAGAKPVLSDQADYRTRFVSYSVPNNNINRLNRGVELEMDLGKFQPIKTTFNIMGAYTSTRSVANNHYILQQNVAGRETTRIGVFASGRGTIDERIVTTIRAIHHIPELSFIVTLSAQTIWMDKNRYLNYESQPIGYIPMQNAEALPAIQYFTDEERKTINNINDPDLYLNINEAIYRTEKWDPLWLFNLKLTKEFKAGLNFSFFANNFINYRPLESSTRYPNTYYKRNISIFFGTEISIKL